MRHIACRSPFLHPFLLLFALVLVLVLGTMALRLFFALGLPVPKLATIRTRESCFQLLDALVAISLVTRVSFLEEATGLFDR